MIVFFGKNSEYFKSLLEGLKPLSCSSSASADRPTLCSCLLRCTSFTGGASDLGQYRPDCDLVAVAHPENVHKVYCTQSVASCHYQALYALCCWLYIMDSMTSRTMFVRVGRAVKISSGGRTQTHQPRSMIRRDWNGFTALTAIDSTRQANHPTAANLAPDQSPAAHPAPMNYHQTDESRPCSVLDVSNLIDLAIG